MVQILATSLHEIIKGRSLTMSGAEAMMDEILQGQYQPEQIGALLTAFHFRAPKASEIAGFAKALRRHTIPLVVPPSIHPSLIDVCGTGGDSQGTFNISTTVAFVVAASGLPIAKHGNRAVSSRSGSFDVLEALRVSLSQSPGEALESLAKFNLAFLFAPSFQPAFRDLAPIRKALGFRTIFNLLGPLLNPALVQRQLIGVYSKELVVPVAEALGELGCVEAMVVHGDDGCDELSLCAPSSIAHLRNGRVTVLRVTPEEFGFQSVHPSRIIGGSPVENGQILLEVLSKLNNEEVQADRTLGFSLEAARNITALNAGAAIFVGGRSESLQEGITQAQHIIQSGQGRELLERMRSR
jgi:anthranilate phosphoribosyltransferase